MLRKVDHLIIVKIEAGNGEVGFGILRFFFDPDHFARLIKFRNAIGGRIGDMIAEDRRACLPRSRAFEKVTETAGIKNIIAENQSRMIITDMFCPNNKGLRQTIWRRLHRIGKIKPPLRTVFQDTLENCLLLRRRNDQNIPDISQHQRRQRIIDHGLIIYRHQLFADPKGQRMKSAAGAARKNNSLMRHNPVSTIHVKALRYSISWTEQGLKTLKRPPVPWRFTSARTRC